MAEAAVQAQLLGADSSLWADAAAAELLQLSVAALEHQQYPVVAVGSDIPRVQVTASAGGHDALPEAASGDELDCASSLVQLLCLLVKTLSKPPIPVLGPTASAGSMLCEADTAEPCSQTPAVPPVSGSSQGEQPASASTAAGAAVCRVFEAFVRHQTHTLSLASECLPTGTGSALECFLKHKGVVSDIARVCSAPQQHQNAAGPLPALAAATGPGSKLQVQLFSLWSSLLKLDASLLPFCEEYSTVSQVNLSALCAETALFMLECSKAEQATGVAVDATLSDNDVMLARAEQAAVTAGEPAGEVTAPDTALGRQTAGVNSGETGTTSTSVHPGSDLMWIMLLGRCFLQWAVDHAAVVQAARRRNMSDTDLILEFRSVLTATSPPSCSTSNSVFPATTMSMRLVMETVQVTFRPDSSLAQQLSVCGYDISPVTDSATAALAALDAFLQSPDSTSSAATGALTELATSVEAVGAALTALAAPYCCNNPRCLNINGPSDVALVSGKSCVCGKCKVARYCGRGCQQQHWRLHKPVCKALAAAQAAGASEESTNTAC